MKTCFRLLLALTVFLAGVPVQAQMLEREELIAACTVSAEPELQRFTTFVNGESIYNWEIRLLKKGDHFNYELCFDNRSKTDLRQLPQQFGENRCQLASEKWVHVGAHQAFKANLAKILKTKIQELQVRQDLNEDYEMIAPVIKAAEFFSNHMAELMFTTATLSLWALGRMQAVPGAGAAIKTGNMLSRINKSLAIFSLITLSSLALYADATEPQTVTVKDDNGDVVTEAKQAAGEIQEIMREMSAKTGLTEEQLPKTLRLIYEQLKGAIPAALEQTNDESMGCMMINGA